MGETERGEDVKVPTQRTDDAPGDYGDQRYRDPYDQDRTHADPDADLAADPGPAPDADAGTDADRRVWTAGPDASTAAEAQDTPVRHSGAYQDDNDVLESAGQDTAVQDAVVDHAPVANHAASGSAMPYGEALFDQDPEQVHTRWHDVQAGFVDDPREAVERADGLLEELVAAVTSGLSARTGELRDRWKDPGEQDTEQLRLALRDYRGMLERLLTLSGPGTR
ncbi:hypothetical protein OIE66_25075 [Nonomuraea sp. NBC_01738]|uniref:hypothetical protein n=1 Tax=Nonomuraea sp. NBC_01738 TaxID=2976003 RepID=UPI002E15DD42|nr:hypothetical protein OIE66_25075 [Nonomuraea sp. NBC_01738]